MGQKIHPKGFRLGTTVTWSSRWFADDRRYKELLLEDVKLREFVCKRLKPAGFLEVEIERSINKMKLIIHVSRPGIVIGRGGSGLEELKRAIESFLLRHRADRQKILRSKNIGESGKLKVEITVEPVKEPNLNAFLVGTFVSDQLVRRIPAKRVCHQALERSLSQAPFRFQRCGKT
jgi:small subunit ribosomal protein S3